MGSQLGKSLLNIFALIVVLTSDFTEKCIYVTIKLRFSYYRSNFNEKKLKKETTD